MIGKILYRLRNYFWYDFCYYFLRDNGVDKLRKIAEDGERMRKEDGCVNYGGLAGKHFKRR